MSSKHCKCKCSPDTKAHYMTIRLPVLDSEKPITIYWNEKQITSGDSVITDNSNRLRLMTEDNQVIADILIDSGAHYIHTLIISDSCSNDACYKSLCGRICSLGQNYNPIPVTNMNIYPSANTNTTARTDGNGRYNLCFGNNSYDYRYKRDGSIYQIHVTVNNQNDPDLRIDVYLDDSSEPLDHINIISG